VKEERRAKKYNGKGGRWGTMSNREGAEKRKEQNAEGSAQVMEIRSKGRHKGLLQDSQGGGRELE